MALVVLTILLYIFFIVFDLLPLYMDKRWKAFWVYTVIIVIALTISIASISGYKVPSPAGPLKRMVMSITGQK